MIIDEALGALVYMLKREAVLGPGPAFTAHLEVDYKKVKLGPAAFVSLLLVALLHAFASMGTSQQMRCGNI
jgi:hypothetical protein